MTQSFSLARQHGTWFDMDIYNDDYILRRVPPTVSTREPRQGEDDRAQAAPDLPRAHAAGVKMLFGTDAGVYPHGTNAKQFAKMVEWGMTPMQAIQAATRSAAEALDRSADVGAIAPGRYADLIAVDADPLTDIHTLEHVAVVIKGGQVVKSAAP